MFKKLSDKFSKEIIYLAAFLVTALMAVMMIHIVKESIPAISQLGIKMFLPTTEWRPVSQKPQYGLLPAIAGTLYVSAIAVVPALIFGVACACFLDYYLPKKVASLFLCVHRSGCRNPVRHLRIYRTYGSCKSPLPPTSIWQPVNVSWQPESCWGSCFYHSLFPPVMNLYRLHERLTSSVRSHLILQRIYPAAFYSSGNPAGNHCRCNDGIRPRTWRDNGSHDGNR